MRESCTSGSVRGARGNSRPYRNTFVALHESGCGTKRRRPRVEFTSAFGRAAEVHGRTASAAFEAYDPDRK